MKTTELKGKEYAGSNLYNGWTYHDLPGNWGWKHNSHRKQSRLRVNQIIEHLGSVRGLHGCDLGCNVGGLTFRLQMAGAHMTGFDYDRQSIDIAHGLESIHRTGAYFSCREITPGGIDAIPPLDFVLFLDCWMWVAQKIGVGPAREVLSNLEAKAEVLFFSTSENNSMAKSEIKSADDVRELLETCTNYKVEPVGTVADGWHERTMFKCVRQQPS